jgi:hypothetical protein
MKIYTAISLFVLILLILLFIAHHNGLFWRKSREKVTVDKNLLVDHVKYLTSLNPPRNHRNLDSLNQAADYIRNEFLKSSELVEVQRFEVAGKEYQNIIVSFGFKNSKRILIGAHYDVCGENPGADDNASGVAGLLELARLLKSTASKLKKRIDLVAYSLEEPPYFKTNFMGSAIHAQSLFDQHQKIELMICLEMIGYYSNRSKSQEYPLQIMNRFYPDHGNFIGVVGRVNEYRYTTRLKNTIKKNTNIKVVSLSTPIILPGIDFSDHLNYWKYKYHAIMVTDTAFYRNINYHQDSDTIDTLDFDNMAEVLKGVYLFIKDM